MKNAEKWKPSKYESIDGQLRGSRDPVEVAVSSRFVADMTAVFYSRAIPAYAKGKIVDLGCGKAPLYGLYKNHSTEVILTDWPQTFHQNECLDIATDLTQDLPFQNNEFETVLLSDVLEHIPEPEKLLKEIYRILCPQGKLLMNTPFYYPLHEVPYDYFRYTEYALRFMAETAGFKIIELDSFGGIPAIIIDLLGKNFSHNKFTGKFLIHLIYKIGKQFENKSFQKSGRKRFPLGYYMVAEK
jgi:SAM-dependent methyltransferase